MKVAALISGGKDSCYNMMTCIAEGHEIVALANLRPEDKDELDSYMYQTVGHHAIDLYAEAMDLPLYTRVIKGTSLSIGREYQPQEGDEVEDLYELLSQIKSEIDIDAVSVGAILSDYQRVRVENVCQRLGLQPLAFLWMRNQECLLKEMIDCGVKAIIIKVAAMGLLPDKHLGMELKDMFPHMKTIRRKYQVNECGEGGEYETFVFDCPIFKKAIVIEETEQVIHSHDDLAPVGYLNLKKCSLRDKPGHDVSSFVKTLDSIPISTSKKWLDKQLGLDKKEEGSHQDYVDSDDSSNDGWGYKRFGVDKMGDEDRRPIDAEAVPQEDVSFVLASTEKDFDIAPLCKTDGKIFQVSGIRAVLDSASGDLSQATGAGMDFLKSCVEKLGHQMSELISVSLYVNSMSNYKAINEVYKKYFVANPPTRICIQVPLPPTVLFLLDCEGFKPEETDQFRTLCVRSLSLWAPVNLGPFSQSVMVNGRVLGSGTTALVPTTMKLIEAGVTVQSRVALGHLIEKLYGLWRCSVCSNSPMMTCYVTKREDIVEARKTFEKFLDYSNAGAINLTPTVQYCIVPKLPQGALVEWQTYNFMFTDCDDEELGLGQESLKYSNWSCEVDLTWYRQNASCVMEVFSCQPSAVDLNEVANALVKAFQKGTAKRKQKSPPTGGLAKIFYLANVFTHKQVAESFTQALTDPSHVDYETFPTLSFVPVMGLNTTRQFLSWCQ